MHFPRMTTRRWMIAVAVVAITSYGSGLRSRAIEYRDCASNWMIAEKGAILERDQKLLEAKVAEIDAFESKNSYKGDLAGRSATERARLYRTQAALMETRVSYCATMSAKYERAASRPWLPVPPDPPERK